jgi:hypothetical protein
MQFIPCWCHNNQIKLIPSLISFLIIMTDCPICYLDMPTFYTLPCCRQHIHFSCLEQIIPRRCPFCRAPVILNLENGTVSFENPYPIPPLSRRQLRIRIKIEDYVMRIHTAIERINDTSFIQMDLEWLSQMYEYAGMRELSNEEDKAIDAAYLRCVGYLF